MRIISKFRDYYDIGLSYGIDPKLVYQRETTEHLFKSLTDANEPFVQKAMSDEDFEHLVVRSYMGRYFRKGQWISSNIYPDLTTIMFCGRVYPVLTFTRHYPYSDVTCCYNAAAVDAFVVEHGDKKTVTAYMDEPAGWSKRALTDKERVVKLFEDADKMNERKSFLTDIHLLARSPIISINTDSWFDRGNRIRAKFVLNPCLKDYQFQKACDPYTAFQELSMFMSNVIGIGDPETVEIADEHKIAEHGFNENSFRHPTKIPHRKDK